MDSSSIVSMSSWLQAAYDRETLNGTPEKTSVRSHYMKLRNEAFELLTLNFEEMKRLWTLKRCRDSGAMQMHFVLGWDVSLWGHGVGCGGLSEKCPPSAWAFEHLVPRWWHCWGGGTMEPLGVLFTFLLLPCAVLGHDEWRYSWFMYSLHCAPH